MAESGGSTRRAADLEWSSSQQQHLAGGNRSRSLGRSRSRGRTPASELLARKQRLLESSGHLHEISWSNGAHDAARDNDDDDDDTPGAKANLTEHHSLRPQARRARRPDSTDHQQAATPDTIDVAGEARQQSIEAKLESLSEFLKQQQQQQADQLTSTTANNQVPHTPTSAKSIDDVYILLAKKEKDLQLAAELGKVLLEKNDELSKANERITEDYSHKLELLEQDKHKLKRKLDQLDGEYENRLIELQTDCNILKNQLDEQQQLAKQAEKEKSKLIDDLVQQNQRLTSELVEATKSEELLSSQLEQMNERFNSRLSNRQDHDAQLEALKGEIQIVNQRKQDLERRLKLANSDKSNLSAALDESGDKLVLLENLLNDKDGKLGELLDEVNELRDSSLWLSSELEAMISANERMATLGGGGDAGSEPARALFASHERKRSQLIDKLKELRLKNRSRLKANELILINRRSNETAAAMTNHGGWPSRKTATIWPAKSSAAARTNKAAGRRPGQHSSLFDEIESSNEGSSSGANRSSDSTNESLSDDDDELDDDNDRDARHPWKEETAAEIYTLLRRFQLALQARKDGLAGASVSSSTAPSLVVATATATPTPAGQHPRNSNNQNGFHAQQPVGQQHLYGPNSTDDSGISGDDIDKMANSEQAQQAKDPAQWRRLLTSLGSLIEEMPCSTCHLMIAERADYEQLQKLHSKLLEEVRTRNDQLLALNMVKMEQETKLAALEERCAFLSEDLSNCDKPKEEIVKLAWKARDEAVERKNSAEISLAKTRIENMQIASQLMEAVQQKGELSQRLAQFEDDIHYITQDSVKAKFTWEEYAEKLRRSKTPQPDSTTISNPLVQLLNFSVSASSSGNSTNVKGGKSSATENTTISNTMAQSAGLMRNFSSNRFNLRFWQRSNSSEKAEDNKGVFDDISKGNSITSVTAERLAS